MRIYKIAQNDNDIETFMNEYAGYVADVLSGFDDEDISEEILREKYTQIKQEIVENIQNNPYIYRNIRYDGNPLTIKTFGVFWSNSDIGYRPTDDVYDNRFELQKGKSVTFVAKINNLQIIDFPATVAAQMTYPTEYEIRLKEGANVHVVQINGESVNIDGIA